MRLEELIETGESFLRNVNHSDFGDYIRDSKGYAEWATKSLMVLQSTYPKHPQTERFDFWVKRNRCDVNECEQLIAILKAFYEINPRITGVDYENILTQIF